MLEDILILVPILLVLIVIFNIFIYVVNYQRYKQSSYYRITHNPYFDILWNAGKRGEYSIYKKLKFLEKDRNKILFNLYIPRENNKFTEIDIVLLTTKGLFVIESKNFKGWIFGNENQKMWTQTLPSGYNCHKEQFYNPIKQNSTHIKYLRKIITDSIPIESIVVFSDSCTFKNVNVNSSTNVIQEHQLISLIKSLINDLPTILSKDKIDIYYNKLFPYTKVDKKIKNKHIQSIKSFKNKHTSLHTKRSSK